MKKTETKKKIPEELQDQEYTANRYVMKCFGVTMLVFALTFLLNVIGVFVIQQRLMICAFVPSVIIYLLVFVATRFVSLSNPKVKYFILFSIALMFTVAGVFLTYHVVLVPVLLFLCATLYSSRAVMRYTYLLTVLSTVVTVYGGYYFGLCDANMTLLTTNRMQDYVLNGQFILTQVNTEPLVSLFLFFVMPRCLIYIAFLAVCGSIYEIVKKNVEKARHAAELEHFQAELENKVNEQTEEIRNQQKKLEGLFVQTITALSEAVDANDRYTSGHSTRVAEYAYLIAERMGKSKEEQEEIYRAGLLHDVGKIRIPADIINKPGRLTEEEFNIIRIHPATGYHILRGISEDSLIAVAAKYHHERYDGKGYPNGLSGKKIPEIARIIGIADAYDAMTSNRSYRNALPQEVVRGEIEKCKGTQFDPDIAEIMLQMIDEDKDYLLKQAESVRRTIMAVDSEAANGQAIADIMSDEPMYEVVSVENGTQALEVLERQSVDVILLDFKTLKADGLKTLGSIREMYQGPLVLMSGDNTLDISTVLSEYGCDDYITKPLLPLLVKEIIYNMTKRTNVVSF